MFNRKSYDSDRLTQAVFNKDASIVATILSKDPSLALMLFENNGSLLQIAISVSTPAIVNLIIDAENRVGLRARQHHSRVNNNGWNTLHLVCCFGNEAMIKSVIRHLGKKTCHELSQQVPNDCGLLPVMMLEKNSHQISARTQKRVLRMCKQKIDLEHTQEIDLETVLNNLEEHQRDTLLEQTLTLACVAANKTRREIVVSNTHCDSNTLPNISRSHHQSFMHEMRQAVQFQQKGRVDDAYTWLQLARRAYAAKKYSTGNCIEYASFVAYELIKLGIPDVEVFQMRNGDHAFVVLNRDTLSKVNDYHHWGDDAYIVDAWSGRIFPAHEILEKLPTFTRLYTNGNDKPMSQVNVCGKLNPYFHTFVQQTSLSNEFIGAIHDFYQCFPFLDGFYNIETICHAITMTRDFINTITRSAKGFSLLTALNPFRARMLETDNNLEKIEANLQKGETTAHEALADFINQFICYNTLIKKYKKSTPEISDSDITHTVTNMQTTTYTPSKLDCLV